MPPYYLPVGSLVECLHAADLFAGRDLIFTSGEPRPTLRLLSLLGFASHEEVQLSPDEWSLTSSGEAFVASRATDLPERISPAQARLVRDALARPAAAPLARTIARILATAASSDAVDHSSVAATFTEWDRPTAQAQADRYSTLLHELEVLDDDERITRSGITLLERLNRILVEPRDNARVWLVRAGTRGENEDLTRDESVSVVGWSELGELSSTVTRDELRDRIRVTYGEERARSLDAEAGSIHRFIHDVQVGDLVVLPLQTQRRRVSIGVVVDDYAYRPEGAFAGRDAHHTRTTRWLTWAMPYQQFEDDIQAAFNQQGTLSEISRDAAPARIMEAIAVTDESIHLVLKWSERYGPKTVEEHRKVADEFGEVWWTVFGRTDRPKLADRWRNQLFAQLEAGTPTKAYISGPTCWVADLVDFTDEIDTVPSALVPAREVREHSLLVKLINFRPSEREWMVDHLDLAASAGRPLTLGALGNQTNPLIVRRAGPRRAVTRRMWWVNQNRSYVDQRDQDILWAPKVARDGSTRSFWRTLQDVEIGDLVLHYSDGSIKAVSEIADTTEDAVGSYADVAATEGWLVRTRYRELEHPLPLDAIPVDARIAEGGPFSSNGAPNQGYFYPLSDGFVNELARDHPALGLQPADDAQPLLKYAPPPFPAIEAALIGDGLCLDPRIMKRYHSSLQTRGFVILAGVSGGGKTWLAEAYARALGAEWLVVPVAPNWTTNEDLLGYAPALQEGDEESYRHTTFSRFLQRAAAEHASAEAERRGARPYHLILDEMNLARVEYYFAKFLSAMEQRARYGTATIELSDGLTVPLTPNLVFIGTVNVDETTFGFADKVYDRAQMIEIGVSRALFAQHLAKHAHGDVLMALWEAVQPVAPFAFRAADEIAAYVEAANELGVDWNEALDDQVLQKILPKVKGTNPKLGVALTSVVGILDPGFPLSAAKARTMLEDYERDGLVKYF